MATPHRSPILCLTSPATRRLPMIFPDLVVLVNPHQSAPFLLLLLWATFGAVNPRFYDCFWCICTAKMYYTILYIWNMRIGDRSASDTPRISWYSENLWNLVDAHPILWGYGMVTVRASDSLPATPLAWSMWRAMSGFCGNTYHECELKIHLVI